MARETAEHHHAQRASARQESHVARETPEKTETPLEWRNPAANHAPVHLAAREAPEEQARCGPGKSAHCLEDQRLDGQHAQRRSGCEQTHHRPWSGQQTQPHQNPSHTKISRGQGHLRHQESRRSCPSGYRRCHGDPWIPAAHASSLAAHPREFGHAATTQLWKRHQIAYTRLVNAARRRHCSPDLQNHQTTGMHSRPP